MKRLWNWLRKRLPTLPKPSYYDPLELELIGLGAIGVVCVIAAILALAFLFSGCVGALQGGTIGTGSPQGPFPVYNEGVLITDGTGTPLPEVTATLTVAGYVYRPVTGLTDPHKIFSIVGNGPTSGTLHAEKTGYVARDVTVNLGNQELAAVALDRAHVDPSTFTLEQLSKIRGAMWTARLNLPFGPFPNTDQNSIAFDFYSFYSQADRQRMIAAYKARGYTHVVTGPVSGTDCYHNQWPCHDQRFPAWMPTDGPPSQGQWDAYLDDIQELWDAGLTPVFFAKPDGWEGHLDWLDQLDALFAQPRSQRLLRVVTYPGWEPSGSKYGWDNDTWLYFVQRGARVFPNALRLLHTPADLDAPTGGQDENRGYTNGQTWRYVAPYIHGWLSQWGGYVFSGDCTPSDSFKNELAGALSDSVGRFKTGKAGWPVDSAWGQGQPVRVYYAEGASYIYFTKGCAEGPSLDLGDIAIRAGVAGYLDGGRLAVQ